MCRRAANVKSLAARPLTLKVLSCERSRDCKTTRSVYERRERERERESVCVCVCVRVYIKHDGGGGGCGCAIFTGKVGCDAIASGHVPTTTAWAFSLDLDLDRGPGCRVLVRLREPKGTRDETKRTAQDRNRGVWKLWAVSGEKVGRTYACGRDA